MEGFSADVFDLFHYSRGHLNSIHSNVFYENATDGYKNMELVVEQMIVRNCVVIGQIALGILAELFIFLYKQIAS